MGARLSHIVEKLTVVPFPLEVRSQLVRLSTHTPASAQDECPGGRQEPLRSAGVDELHSICRSMELGGPIDIRQQKRAKGMREMDGIRALKPPSHTKCCYF